MFHIFGDSHAAREHSGWRHCPNVITHHIPGTLCFSFGRDRLKRCNISNYNINDGDSVIFCFGEIDCRNHVHKHITPTNTYKHIIDKIIENYIIAIKENLENCNKKLKHVCIYNVVPPCHYIREAPTHPFPYLGTDEERRTYALYFNKVVKEKCKENNYIFFDIYDKVKDEHGFLNRELSDNNCHLIDGKAMNEFLDKLVTPLPKVFIISATRGGAQFIENLKSVQQQTYEKLEHVVVVDGSEFEEKVDEHIKSLENPKVKISKIVLPWNTGRNKYLCHKIYASIPQLIHKPAYVSFLDEDNFIEPNHISSMVEILTKNNYLWCFCLRNIIDQKGKFICRDMCESLGNLSHAWINPNYFLVDTNCYIINVEIMQRMSHCFQRPCPNPTREMEADRFLFHNLSHHFKHFGCSNKYTVNYRVASRGSESVTGEFFMEGNRRMNIKYNNSIPWDV